MAKSSGSSRAAGVLLHRKKSILDAEHSKSLSMQSNNTPKQIIIQHIDKSSFWSVDGEVIYQIAHCVLPLGGMFLP